MIGRLLGSPFLFFWGGWWFLCAGLGGVVVLCVDFGRGLSGGIFVSFCF